MITVANLPRLLSLLGFSQSGSRYTRSFSRGVAIVVDTKKRVIQYPADLRVNEAQVLSFSAPENFVVLECVSRLLELGYAPQHVELEPRWRVGHGPSGGRADILVSDHTAKPLLLIECKTAGHEFDAAWKETQLDGGQLFAYAQQISDVQFLTLYTADIVDDAVERRSNIIAHRDNDAYLVDKPELVAFRDARDVKSRVRVWQNTYKGDYSTKGIFELSASAYEIGKDRYSLKDLAIVSAADGRRKYNEFATILRQHNVSGRENAFDTLINLFLCKLVDEASNPDDLRFYWKGVAYDNHFDLLDRLQQLYQSGMSRFLNEEITYINNEDVVTAMRFIDREPDATERAVLQLFHKQRFFTNSDFSFIDVHNEGLFYQNAAVLLKVLQMWQDVRLTGNTGESQFLGDMFEGFLDQGIKQSEGQFFTPMPICRFMLRALPLAQAVEAEKPPRVVDYACGAGHFLNEYALQIAPLVDPESAIPLTKYHSEIYGLEKEYRLSKVAKVSAFMYGQPDIKIRYADALATETRDLDDTCDILVANPPYSVKGFLATLDDVDREKFTLTSLVDKPEVNGAIEAFFVERAKQLLRPGGTAAIILPSSILTNGGKLHVHARELLLEYFDIVAITELGSDTFAKTGTNTVVMFLRRRESGPETPAHYKDRVHAWFSGQATSSYDDASLIDQYATHLGLDPEDYYTLLAGDPNDAVVRHPLFRAYRREFDASAPTRQRVNQAGFKAMTKDDQTADLLERFVSFARAREQDRAYYFALAAQQPNDVVVTRMPEGSKARKAFLGYEWSAAKGNEGIHLFENEFGHDTPLYHPTERGASNKIATLIEQNFLGTFDDVPDELAEFVTSAPLTSLLDFAGASFKKEIALVPYGPAATIESKFESVPLADVAEIQNGSTPDTSNPDYWTNGDVPWVTLADTTGKYVTTTERSITKAALGTSKMLPEGTVLWSSRATIGQAAIAAIPLVTNQGFKNFMCNPDRIDNEYLYYLLSGYRTTFEKLVPQGSKYKEINTARISNFLVPLPPMAEQKRIAAGCAAIDADLSDAVKELAAARQSLAELAATLLKAPERVRLGEVVDVRIGGTPSRRVRSYFQGVLPWVSISDMRRQVITDTREKITPEAVSNSNVKLIPKDTTLLSFKLSIGRTAVAGADLYTNEAIAGLVPRDSRVSNEFLFAYFSSVDIERSHVGNKAFGQSLNSAFLRNDIEIPRVDARDQAAFADSANKLLALIAQGEAADAKGLIAKQAILDAALKEKVQEG